MILIIFLPVVSCFQILSQFTNVYVQGGGDDVLSVNNTMTVRCTLQDYGTTQTFEVVNAINNATKHTVKLTCGIPKHYFKFKRIGVVPRNGSIVISQACEQRLPAPGSQDPSTLLAGQPSRVVVNHGSRRLLQFTPVLAAGFVGGILGGVASRWMCKLSFLSGACGDGGLGAIRDDITGLKTGLGELRNTTADLNTKIAAEMTASNNLARQVAVEFDLVNASLQANLAAIVDLRAEAVDNAKTITANSHEIISVLGELDSFTAQTQSNFVSLDSRTTVLQTQVSQLSNSINSEIRGIISNITTLFDAVQDNQRASNERLLAETREAKDRSLRTLDYIRDVVGLIQDIRERVSARRILTRSVLDSIAFVLPALGLQPFLPNLGTRGNTDGLWYLVVERYRVNRFISVANLIVAEETAYAFRCRVDVVIERLGGWSTIRDFLQRIGPANCSVANLTCDCYVSVDTKICQPASPSVSSPWLVSEGILQSTDCVSNSTPSASQILITTPAGLYQQFKASCLVPTFNSSYSSVYVHQDRLGMVAKATSDTTRCTDDPSAYSRYFGDGTFSAAQVIVQMFPIAVSKSRDVFGRILDQYDGVLPDDLTYRDTPFTHVEKEQASCIEAGFMAFDQVLLPLVALEFSHSQVEVAVEVDNVTVLVTDVSMSSDAEVGIPAGMLTVGWPNDTQTVYDIDQSDLSTSPMESAQKGKVTYSAAQNEAEWSIGKWKERMGVSFDHYAATNVAALYKRSVIAGGCVGGKLTEGSWCSRLERWEVVPSGVDRIAFEPRSEGSYTATVAIPQGNIFTQRFPACPTISIDATNPLGKTLSMTNRQSTPMDVTVLVRGGCTRNYDNIRIDPNTVRHLFVPACDNPALNHQDVAVYYWDRNGDPSTTPCGNQRYDVTTDYSVNIAQPFTMADAGYVRRTAVNTVDATSLALADVMQSVTQYMMQIALAQLQMIASMGIPINASTVLNYQNIVLQNTLSPEAIANITAKYRLDFNISEQIVDYASRVAQQERQAALDRAATDRDIDIARRAAQNVGGGLEILQNLTAEAIEAKKQLAAAQIAYLNTQLNFSTLLVKTLQDIGDKLGSDDPGGLFGYIFDGLGRVIVGCTHGDGLCGKAAAFVGDIADAVIKLVELPFKIFGGLLDFLFQIALMVAVSAVVSFGVFKFLEYRKAQAKAAPSPDTYVPKPAAQ